MLSAFAKWVFGLKELQRLYENAVAVRGSRNIFESLAEVLNISPLVSTNDLERIPCEGPLLVVSNHPTGGLDGILLTAQILRIRPDLKVLSHAWFQRFPDLAEHMTFIDPSPGGSITDRKKAIAEAIECLGGGAAMLVYPSGAVSYYSPSAKGVVDPPWRAGCVRLLRATRATVLPVHAKGRNSLLFQVLSVIHPRLGATRLPRELISQHGRQLAFTIGDPIPFEALPNLENDAMFTDFLRKEVYRLANRDPAQTLEPAIP